MKNIQLNMASLATITPAASLAAAAILLVAGILLAIYGERAFQAQKAKELDVQARILASTVSAALSFGDRQAAQEYVNAVKANPEVIAVAIYDATDTLFVSFANSADRTLPRTP